MVVVVVVVVVEVAPEKKIELLTNVCNMQYFIFPHSLIFSSHKKTETKKQEQFHFLRQK